MSRPLRIQYPNAVYHVMNRGTNRRPIFLAAKDYRNFLDVLEQSWQRWKIDVYAYCLIGEQSEPNPIRNFCKNLILRKQIAF